MTRWLALILALARKDWRLFWADRRAALLCFAVPIVLASAFGLIFARPTESQSSPRLPVLLVVEDDGPLTRRIAADILASERFDAVEVASREEAERRVSERRPGIALVLRPGFERLDHWVPGAAERSAVEILHHSTTGAERQWAEGAFTEVVMQRLAKEKFGNFFKGEAEAMSAPPFRVEVATVVGPAGATFNTYSHSFSGMTLQYLLFWGMESGLLLLRERQRAVAVRVRASPVTLWTVLFGKSLCTSVIALLIVAVTFGFGRIAFGVAINGSLIGFALLALAACALAAAVGLLVAAIGGTEARARAVSILVILGVSMVGGLWLPSFLLPGWVRDFALALPTTWAMRGLDGVTWQGKGLWASLPNVLVLGGFAAAFLAIAAFRLAQCERRVRACLG